MTAIEVAVKVLVDLAQNEGIDPGVRCDAAQALLARQIEGDLVFASYNEQGRAS